MPVSKPRSVLYISRTHYLAVRMQKNAVTGICQNKIFRGYTSPEPLARVRAYGAQRSDL